MPVTQTLPDAVAAAVAAWPDNTALVAADATLTYAQLIAAAQETADTLRGIGVVGGAVVAVCLPRSAALVVAELAVTMCGAAYLALDPAEPPARLNKLLTDSRVPFLVASPEMLHRLTTEPVTRLAGMASVAATGVNASQPHEPGLVYVLYTSGSTGSPKGVMVTHPGLLNLLHWHQRIFEVAPGVRCGQLGGPAFDASGWEIWGALTAGATLVIPEEVVKTDPGALRDWLIDERIEVAFVPTPLAEALCALRWRSDVALRLVLTGGDRLRRAPVTGLPFTVVNNYGVTEATVVSTSGALVAGLAGVPSIGTPIDNVLMLVVDEGLSPVAHGEPGELLVGGVCLARGYLHQPSLTAERFIEMPDQRGDSRRWYRTGDIVRERAGGELDYLGRVDEQVQIRGVRVEPGEVMAAVCLHPGVAECLVTVEGKNEPQLVCYVRAVDGLLEDSVLRGFLERTLPAAMVPGSYVFVEAMPMTTNGKIDRRRLAELPRQRAAVEAPDTAGGGGETALEHRIGEIIAGVLGLVSVPRTGNFLLLGGHSLIGAQLVMRLAQEFGVELSLRALFAHPTVSEIANEVHGLLVAEISALSEEDVAAAADRGLLPEESLS